ncbi:hypothetical protein MC885_020607 [Smutsia gigantea]|nr:hypothetical protein MC885_020607 [Smutsia gigantea]
MVWCGREIGRLFHHPIFHKRIPKEPKRTAPVGMISPHVHPIECSISNMLPVMVGPIAMGSRFSSITVWISSALIISTDSHCGYHLPFLPSPEFHDYHHFNFWQQTAGLLDCLHGTDAMFKQTKAYERHTILLGFTPLSESIPEPPKME